MPQAIDVLIVGGGAAGCVLAARLSEDRRRRVLLLEAGPDYPDASALPAEVADGRAICFSHDWGITARACGERVIAVPRARLVGGSSATNATFALRGRREDYDEWARLGNPGWSFEEVLPYFKRLEADRDFDGPHHGRSGPVPIRRAPPRDWTTPHAAFVEAARACGHACVEDHNAPEAVGVGPIPMNCVDGRRQSAALVYLAPARTRPNLVIRPHALADRILFEGRRAIGVRLASGETLTADRVVLAAGAYGSPALLLRSGIGPAAALHRLGIAARDDWPGVGAHLQDHAVCALRYAVPTHLVSSEAPTYQVLLTLRAQHAAAGGPQAQAFPTSPVPCPAKDSPSGAQLSIKVSALKPASYGQVMITSTDPTAALDVRLGYFDRAGDLEVLMEAMAQTRAIAAQSALAPFLLQELWPGPEADLADAIRRSATTYHHACGTCRMGQSVDAGAVVDAHGTVHGLRGLSVVDASIFPTLPAANTHLPTLMVAERCADLLAAD